MYELALKSFLKLEQYCKEEGFKGWDPYDGLNSRIFQALPILPKKRLPRLVWIQLIKKLPFNLRPVLHIRKDFNPKGIALFLSGYSNLSRIDRFRNDSLQKIDLLARELLSLRTPGYSGNCWGYNFDWESKAFFQPKFTPTIVATCYAANAFLDAYEATGNDLYLNAAIDSKHFILKDLKRTSLANGDFAFSYSPYDQTSVFNASLLGARLLSRIYSYTNDDELRDVSKKAVSYCIEFQNPDGSWFYSTLPFHQWIDNFHTGFNLECIADYSRYCKDNSFSPALKKGIAFYLDTFFDERGRSKYYNNAVYPIDIHAPSQLIITLVKTAELENNIEIAERVLKWTIENMQSAKGYFYFQKMRLYTNKIPYMRWSQGWIFYALSYYLTESVILHRGKGCINAEMMPGLA